MLDILLNLYRYQGGTYLELDPYAPAPPSPAAPPAYAAPAPAYTCDRVSLGKTYLAERLDHFIHLVDEVVGLTLVVPPFSLRRSSLL